MFSKLIDIKENDILSFDYEILHILLQDKTTNKNIIWATNNYEDKGCGYSKNDFITIEKITGSNGNLIKPRTKKNKIELEKRIREKAEVFTSSWICNKQNNLVDEAWFGYPNVFNIEKETSWEFCPKKVEFKNDKTWQDYISSLRMEISCGEAPYLVSRYDSVNGNFIEVCNRIGILDRKFRILNENVDDINEWTLWAEKAIKSIYGFDWQGDNILLARENILFTYIDNYIYKFNKKPSCELIKKIADIIVWNIWQMDGINYVVPLIGCFSKVMNWETNKTSKFIEMKFDAIVGNPPYQLLDGGAKSSATPVYNLFVDGAKKLKPNYISMIIPSRWFTGGKGLDGFRKRMLADKNIRVLHDYLDASICFPGVEIKGGVNYFLRENQNEGKCMVTTHLNANIISSMERYLQEDNCDIFIRYNEAIPIINKVKKMNEASFSEIVSARKPFGFATNFKDYSTNKSDTNCLKIYANHEIGFVSKKQILKNNEWLDKWKVFVPEAIGSGNIYTDKVNPIIGMPNECCTETYLVVGPFETYEEAYNTASYIQTKFFHFMLGIKKITQHTTSKVYEFVPCQNFKDNKEINWSLKSSEIDQQLYRKYNLTEDEIKYIDDAVGIIKNKVSD